MKCCPGSSRSLLWSRFYAARVSNLGPGDFVQVECICGHTERLTAAMLTAADVGPDEHVQDLLNRMRCREGDEKGRGLISIRWAPNDQTAKSKRTLLIGRWSSASEPSAHYRHGEDQNHWDRGNRSKCEPILHGCRLATSLECHTLFACLCDIVRAA